MTERKYSVAEIDLMRQAIERLRSLTSVSRQSIDGSKDVEARLRTYMLNGTSPEELQDAAKAYTLAQRRREWLLDRRSEK